MRSEVEIRRQVEARLHRWLFLLLHGGLWTAVGFGLYFYSRRVIVPSGWVDSAIMVMLLWAGLVGLHVLRTVYVELREYVVRRAVDRERQHYQARDIYEKPKRLEASDDGELIELAAWRDEDAQRSRNS